MSSLSLIQQQRLQLKLTPTQIQVIRMLEIPAFELQQRVNEELQDNPALEEGRDPEELEQERFEEDITAEDEYENPLQTDDFNYDDYVSTMKRRTICCAQTTVRSIPSRRKCPLPAGRHSMNI